MAAHKDIDSDITLEVDGDLPTPGQLAEAITSFSALLNGAHRSLGTREGVKWGVQVKEGSNLVSFYNQTPISPQALGNIISGLSALEDSPDTPAGFDEAMLSSMQSLCGVARQTKTQQRTVKIWLNRTPHVLSENIKRNVGLALQGAFREYGTIEGRLQILDSHDGWEFAIFEPLHNKRIMCKATDQETFDRAYGLYEQRVSADGLIKHTADGVPFEIKVDQIDPLLPPEGLLDYKTLRGILRDHA